MTERIAYLLHQHLKEELSELERTELEAWADSHLANRQLLMDITDSQSLSEALKQFHEAYGMDEQGSMVRMRNRIRAQIGHQDHAIPRWPKSWRYAVAVACILCTVSLAFYFWTNKNAYQQAPMAFGGDASPGGNQATLVLPDGQTVTLDSLQDGIVVNTSLKYVDGGEVVDDDWTEHHTDELLTIATPKGGQYQVTLSDGTKVWLNAESRLRYPLQFAGDKRVVELEGEAYFEVKPAMSDKNGQSHKTGVGFFVKTKNQTVQVLGTQFNIAAYRNEDVVKTTLVTGAIKVNIPNISGQEAVGNELLLKPGEQSVWNKGHVRVDKVNLMPFIGWRKGLFYFDETSMTDAMNQISRWYNVEIVYPTKIPDTYFYGEMSRKSRLVDVLAVLQEAGVRFKIQEDNHIKKLLVY